MAEDKGVVRFKEDKKARFEEVSFKVGRSSIEEDEEEDKFEEMSYFDEVAKRLSRSTVDKHDMLKWLGGAGGDADLLKAHMLDVFAANGISDFKFDTRAKEVESALARQQQMIAERKKRKQSRRETSARHSEIAQITGELKDGDSRHRDKEHHRDHSEHRDREHRHRHSEHHREHHKDHREHHERDHHRSARASVSVAEQPITIAIPSRQTEVKTEGESEAAPAPEVKWREMSAFKTRGEALQFVLECQPFDYQPVFASGESMPKFDSSREMVTWIDGQAEEQPSHFDIVSGPDFKRRLRIRKREEEKHHHHHTHELQKRYSFRVKQVAHKSRDGDRHRIRKPWLVESTGPLFETPASLRDLLPSAVGTKYFIAVDPDIAQKILTEGYKAKQRVSIPCCSTPADAVAAYAGVEQRSGRSDMRNVVLAITVPPNVDVTAHKKVASGFQIRTSELPPSCFRRNKTCGGDGM
eukprot:gnl/TRDRNA2_/TRDRNA2_44978_c0_seq2.p1 gnl/TRDRNA2_/TRDRNA2_44978_c0~~gnl/TRDRNA2_/TRDRNA2_44978_c0_seq2.p1  ORF type:complete len:469 (-),score=93.08 gnl/TRDRNA2_/TRDRNA2_44978_c0_seq2:38-1444(-)